MNTFKNTMTLLIPLISMLALGGYNANGGVVEYRILTSQEAVRIQRFLHPMPHELRISQTAYQFPINECSININRQALPDERQAIDNFKARWLKKYGVALNKKGGELNIIAGLINNSSELQKVAEKGLIDIKYLTERPNSEQAYLISTVVDGKKIKVYVAANAAVGLNYGLLTLGQLFESLSQGGTVVLPHANIVDWPDIKERGFCANAGGSVLFDESTGLLKHYSALKLNVHYDWINMKVSSDKKISYNKSLQQHYFIAKKYFVQEIPLLLHMDYLFNPAQHALCNFPEIAAQGKNGKRIYGSQSGKTFCYSNPKSQDVMDQIFEAIARTGLGNRLQVWLGESKTFCQCALCRGNPRQHFINEVKHIVHAYEKSMCN